MDLQKELESLLKDPSQTQAFVDLFSIDDNWNSVDKNVKVPRETGLSEGECPDCGKTIRAIYNKFASPGKITIVCPHCKEKIDCELEFSGHTTELVIG